MPPKPKFSKNEIVEAALNIVRTEGISGLTARTLGIALGSSARPIFTVFQSMDEVQQTVIQKAKVMYAGYVEKGLSEKQSFKGVGMQYILFSIHEPKLFQILFMTEREQIPDLPGVLRMLDDNYENILSSVQKSYGIGKASAKKLYRHLWLYTHGIAALCATRMCRFTEAEISEMISEVCLSLLRKMKAGEADD